MTQHRCYEPQSSAERLTKVGRYVAGMGITEAGSVSVNSRPAHAGVPER